jgi:outer membrane protein assembly factor BamE (lipoprotein component of BamABCDE complex)
LAEAGRFSRHDGCERQADFPPSSSKEKSLDSPYVTAPHLVMTRTYFPLAIALTGSLTLAGCGLAMPAPIVLEGQTFPQVRAAEIRTGMSPREVEALLGTPLTRAVSSHGETWMYRYMQRRKECRMVVLGIQLGRFPADTHHVEVVFDHGCVERGVYRHHASEGRSEQVIVTSR